MLVIARVDEEGRPDGAYWNGSLCTHADSPEKASKFKDAADAITCAIANKFEKPDADGFTDGCPVLSLLPGIIEQAQARAHTEWMEAHPR